MVCKYFFFWKGTVVTNFYSGHLMKISNYTQTKKTVNAANILGMCVLTNRARGLVAAEGEWVSQSRNRVGSRIVLKGLKI